MINEIDDKQEESDVDSEGVITDYNRLTNWKNEPTINDLKKILDDAQIEHDVHLAKVDEWLDNLNIEGKAKPKTAKGRSKVQPKLIRKQAEWRYSSLSEPFLNSPEMFDINPVTAGDVKRAKQNNLILNNQFNNQINKVAFINEYVRDAVDIGTVVVKTTWETEEQEVETEKPIYEFFEVNDKQVAEQYMALIQMREQDNDAYSQYQSEGLDRVLDVFMQTGQLLGFKQVGSELVIEIKEVKNQPLLEILDIHNVVPDPTCEGNIDNANFIGEKFKSSLSLLKADGKFTNLNKINIEASSPLANPDYEEQKDNTSFNFDSKNQKQFVVYTYWGNWDITGEGDVKQIVMSWVGNTKIRCEFNPFPDSKPPISLIKYMPVRKSNYGEPDGELLEDNQRIIGAVTRGMIDLMARSANSQTGMRKDMLDITNKRKFDRGVDYEFNSNVDPRQGIHQHTFPEIPQSAYNMIMLQSNEAESMSGVKAFSSGITGNSLGNSVANGRSALDAASKREMDILRRLADGLLQIGRKIIAMNAVFLSDEEVVRITNEKFVKVRRDDLAGNFDLNISISTAEEDNQKAQELAFMLQTTGPNSDPGEVRLIRAEIARLRRMPALAKRIEEYQPQPDPLAVAKAQLEIKLLEAQIAKEQALASKHGTEANVNQARTGKEATQAELNAAKANTEKAKSRDLHSSADRRDLDYLEQESGTHQERELQKIQRKAEANIAEKLTEQAVNPQFNNPQLAGHKNKEM